ncbi:MAG: amidohydrolase family protein [Lachnospiraceae bacterium]
MIIDSNMYWLPESLFENPEELEAFLSEIPAAYGTRGFLKAGEGDGPKVITIEKPAGCQNLDYVQGEYRLPVQLADMDAGRVDKAVLKMPGCSEWMSIQTCRRFNDGMAKAAKESGGRLVPLGVVPPYASKACFEEINRCRSMGFGGFQLSAHYGECYLDDDIFKGFFEKLNEEETTIYIHHTPLPVQYDSLLDYNNLRRSYGRCADQTTAICRELFSGFFDRYPNLKMVHSMLGGGFFALANMLFPARSANETVKRFDAGNDRVKEQFKDHIYFEMSHAQPWGKDQLECAVKVLGADHIVFGTSYPVRKEWLTEGAAFVEALDISDEEKEMILSGNAMNLYHIGE